MVLAKVEFGQPLAQSTPAPRYPSRSLMNRVAAEVLLRVTLDASGGVALVEPVTARVLDRAMRNEERHRRLVAPFARASVEAVQSWRFEFSPPGPDGEAPQMLVPIVYTIDGPSIRTGARQPRMRRSCSSCPAHWVVRWRPWRALDRAAPSGAVITLAARQRRLTRGLHLDATRN